MLCLSEYFIAGLPFLRRFLSHQVRQIFDCGFAISQLNEFRSDARLCLYSTQLLRASGKEGRKEESKTSKLLLSQDGSGPRGRFLR